MHHNLGSMNIAVTDRHKLDNPKNYELSSVSDTDYYHYSYPGATYFLYIFEESFITICDAIRDIKIFLDSFIRDPFSNYFKILILLSTLFVLNSSKNFIIDIIIST